MSRLARIQGGVGDRPGPPHPGNGGALGGLAPGPEHIRGVIPLPSGARGGRQSYSCRHGGRLAHLIHVLVFPFGI